jgi:hypothetical protein
VDFAPFASLPSALCPAARASSGYVAPKCRKQEVGSGSGEWGVGSGEPRFPAPAAAALSCHWELEQPRPAPAALSFDPLVLKTESTSQVLHRARGRL